MIIFIKHNSVAVNVVEAYNVENIRLQFSGIVLVSIYLLVIFNPDI